MWVVYLFFFFFKQKTAYEMRISDWSSDVCSSDLVEAYAAGRVEAVITFASEGPALEASGARRIFDSRQLPGEIVDVLVVDRQRVNPEQRKRLRALWFDALRAWQDQRAKTDPHLLARLVLTRSEERRDGKECVSPCRSRGSPAN